MPHLKFLTQNQNDKMSKNGIWTGTELHIHTCKTNDNVVDDHTDALVIIYKDDSSDSYDSSDAKDWLNYIVY